MKKESKLLYVPHIIVGILIIALAVFLFQQMSEKGMLPWQDLQIPVAETETDATETAAETAAETETAPETVTETVAKTEVKSETEAETESETAKRVDPNDTNWQYSREGLSVNITKYTEQNDAGEKIVYWVADVYTENPDEDINTVLSGGNYDDSLTHYKRTSEMAEENDAIFAINGDEFGYRWPDSNEFCNPILIRNGILYYEDDRNIGEMCALRNDGKLLIFTPGELGTGQEMIDSGITDVWWFDCSLVKEGEVNTALIESESVFSNAPYTAIGQKDEHNFIFIVIDGRGSNGSVGTTYTGMARLMQRYGAVTAYELDGGGSTTIWFDGMVLNEPSDGSERYISDIIYVKR